MMRVAEIATFAAGVDMTTIGMDAEWMQGCSFRLISGVLPDRTARKAGVAASCTTPGGKRYFVRTIASTLDETTAESNEQ